KEMSINDKVIDNYTPFKITEDGVHELTIKVTDQAGNETEVEKTIKIDKTKPSSPTIQLDPDGWTNANEVAVTITDGKDQKNGSGVVRTEYILDGDDDWRLYEGPFVIKNAGETLIQARTIDKVG